MCVVQIHKTTSIKVDLRGFLVCATGVVTVWMNLHTIATHLYTLILLCLFFFLFLVKFVCFCFASYGTAIR